MIRHGWRSIRQIAVFAALAASLLLIWIVTFSGPVAPASPGDPAEPTLHAGSAAGSMAQSAGMGR